MATPSPHKPRRKGKKAGNEVSFASNVIKHSAGRVKDSTGSLSTSSTGMKPAYPLAAFMWSARGGVSQWTVLPIVLMVVGMIRWAAGLWGYSGYQNPPMHGDYEAQRHWMEITTQLPISQWYFHDLEWWGLDYPPLTAYHSWVFGKVGTYINPKWFQLYTSRGLDDETLKVFMRASVVISEYLVYIPAAVIFVRRYSRLQGVQTWDSSVALVAILLQPATILIDHVHFQYNTVMLGLVLACASSIVAGRYMWSCVFFVLALGFKQMALYYAPAIFAYLLGVCIFPNINISRFLGIALVTVGAFALLLLPLIAGAIYDHHRGVDAIPELNGHAPIFPIFPSYTGYLDSDAWYFPPVHQLAQLVHRVFPFARGLFEDKVANFWCALNIVYKLKYLPIAQLQRLSLLATLGIGYDGLGLFSFQLPSSRKVGTVTFNANDTTSRLEKWPASVYTVMGRLCKHFGRVDHVSLAAKGGATSSICSVDIALGIPARYTASKLGGLPETQMGQGSIGTWHSLHTYDLLSCHDYMAWPRSVCGRAEGSTRSVGGA
ncbi:hypothetical protein V494_02664 [Pseudogymnoascus sp. VKM F-4513 (FW-928)]|nr:hypothetical protein V494_02664 [Pseudogymnoascus sp. VKM F-4513 (FW-928)]